MKAIKFKGCNTTFAGNQPEYLPLPALKFANGQIITCWEPSLFEVIRILFTRKIWLSVLTFNNPLQPLLLSAEKLFVKDKNNWYDFFSKENKENRKK